MQKDIKEELTESSQNIYFFRKWLLFCKKFQHLHSHSASIDFVPMPRTLKRVKVFKSYSTRII